MFSRCLIVDRWSMNRSLGSSLVIGRSTWRASRSIPWWDCDAFSGRSTNSFRTTRTSTGGRAIGCARDCSCFVHCLSCNCSYCSSKYCFACCCWWYFCCYFCCCYCCDSCCSFLVSSWQRNSKAHKLNTHRNAKTKKKRRNWIQLGRLTIVYFWNSAPTRLPAGTFFEDFVESLFIRF